MELTGKQRARLRAMANGLDTIVHIGKDGVSDSVIHQTDEALEARELVKCRVLENAMLSPKEACQELARRTRSEGVQVIGSRFTLYRESHSKDKKDRIVLEKNRAKPVRKQ